MGVTESVSVAPIGFVAQRDDLAAAMAWVVKGVPRRVNVAVLAGVVVDAAADHTVTVSTFNFDAQRTVRLDGTHVSRPGRVLLSAHQLHEIVKSLPKSTRRAPAAPVTVAVTDAGATLTSGDAVYELETHNIDDYPAPLPEPIVQGRIDAATFAGAVGRVAAAAGKDATLPILTGIKLNATGDGTYTLDATDRYRLTSFDGTWTPGHDECAVEALIPASILVEAGKLFAKRGGQVLIGHNGSPAHHLGAVSLSWGDGSHLLVTRVLDGEFPKVRSLYPDPINYIGRARVDSTALVGAVKALAPSLDKNEPVRLAFDQPGTATVYSRTARRTLAVEYNGTPVTIQFNPTYLEAGVNAAGGTVEFGMVAPKKPAIIVQVDDDGKPADAFRYLIMPVKDTEPAPKPTPAPAPVAETAPDTESEADVTEPDEDDAEIAAAKPSLAAQIVAETNANAMAALAAAGKLVTISVSDPAPAAMEYDAEIAAAVAEQTARRDAAIAAAGAGGVVEDEPEPEDEGIAHPALPADVQAQIDKATEALREDAREFLRTATVEPDPAIETAWPVDTTANARTVEILRTGTWDLAVVKLGKGKERKPVGMDVLKLNAGRLDYHAEYVPVSEVLRKIGGAWNKEAGGFIFEPSRAQFSGGYSKSGEELLTAWLERNADAAPAEPVAVAEPAPAIDAEPIRDDASNATITAKVPAKRGEITAVITLARVGDEWQATNTKSVRFTAPRAWKPLGFTWNGSTAWVKPYEGETIGDVAVKMAAALAVHGVPATVGGVQDTPTVTVTPVAVPAAPVAAPAEPVTYQYDDDAPELVLDEESGRQMLSWTFTTDGTANLKATAYEVRVLSAALVTRPINEGRGPAGDKDEAAAPVNYLKLSTFRDNKVRTLKVTAYLPKVGDAIDLDELAGAVIATTRKVPGVAALIA